MTPTFRVELPEAEAELAGPSGTGPVADAPELLGLRAWALATLGHTGKARETLRGLAEANPSATTAILESRRFDETLGLAAARSTY